VLDPLANKVSHFSYNRSVFPPFLAHSGSKPMMSREEHERFLRRLDELGVDEVRRRKATHTYGEDRSLVVDDWLRQQDQKKQDQVVQRKADIEAEELVLVRRSTDAAERSAASSDRSATAAEKSATRAGLAALISLLAQLSLLGETIDVF
jgi:hypothetical protein